MGASAITAGSRAVLRKPILTKQEVLLAGAVGAFAPQILRWYSQADFTQEFDPWATAGHAGVVVLFLGLAGYVTTLWGVRTLKEAFLVGLAVPSIILGPGSDLAQLARPGNADAQVRSISPRAGVDARSAVGTLDIRVRGNDGSRVSQFRTVATDGRARTYSAETGYMALPAGRYRLSVSAPGFEPAERQVVVMPNRSVEVQLTLRRQSAAQRFLNGANRAVSRH